MLLDDNQRRRLAVKGKILGWNRLADLKPIFTSDTIMRWHSKLVATKGEYFEQLKKKRGRPIDINEVKLLILWIAQ